MSNQIHRSKIYGSSEVNNDKTDGCCKGKKANQIILLDIKSNIQCCGS